MRLCSQVVRRSSAKALSLVQIQSQALYAIYEWSRLFFCMLKWGILGAKRKWRDCDV